LNFKKVHYRTEWVELPEVESVRKKLEVAPVRAWADGSPFYTLPIISDPSTGKFVGDSFDIALYLEETYPSDDRVLFPPSSTGLLRAFNVQVDEIFTRFVQLVVMDMPFNPETAEITHATFCARAGKQKWEEFALTGEVRASMLEDFKAALGTLAKHYRHKEAGPFLEGATMTYADVIVGGWLAYMKETLKEWDDFKTWQDGHWGRLHGALEKYAEIK
jgi:glutathione S-transferase